MHPSIAVPIGLIIGGLVVISLSIPMLLDRIPRNKFYGFRTSLTLSSDEIWYPANRFAAKLLIVWGSVNVLIGIPFLRLLPLSESAQFALFIPPLSIVAICLFVTRWVNKRYGSHTAK
ncbi:MAG: SdpI family protein [Verrucomicrobiota bacterium]